MGLNHEKNGHRKSCDTLHLKEHCHEILYIHFFHDCYPSEPFDFAKLFTYAKNSMESKVSYVFMSLTPQSFCYDTLESELFYRTPCSQSDNEI